MSGTAPRRQPSFPASYLAALLPGSFVGLFARSCQAEVVGLSFHALVYALLGASALALALLCFRRVSRGDAALPPAALHALDASFCAAAVLGVCLVALTNAPSEAVAGIAALMGCWGAAWLTLRWGSRLARLGTEALLQAVLADTLLGCAAVPTLIALGRMWRPWSVAACCCLPLVLSAALLPAADRADIRLHADREVLYRGRDFLGLGGIAFGALAYSLTLVLRARLDYGYGGLTGPVTNIITAALAVAAYVWIFGLHGSPDFYAAFRAMVVAFAASALLAPLAGGGFAIVLDGVMGSVVIIVVSCFVALCAYVSRHSELHAFVVFGLFYAVYGLPRLIEPALDAATANVSYLGSGQAGLYNALILFFSAAALAFSLVRTPPGMAPLFGDYFSPKLAGGARGDRQEPGKEAVGHEAALGAIAAEHGLTDREAQVMGLVCHGRSKSYIAETLFVSENTVKAYSKSLYVKLGVHSKQELIDLVESQIGGSAG